MSTRERLRSSHALILRRRDVNDADRVLTLLTPGEGKVELLAKGVRKTTSRKAGHLEPFAHVQLVIAQARTWDIITEATTVESFRHLRSDLDAIGKAHYVCELVDCFAEPGDENRLLWDLALFALRELDAAAHAGIAGEGTQLLLWFDLHLLALTGFQPEFFHCLGCGNEVEPVLNFLSLAEGGVFCSRCGAQRSDVEPLDVDTLKVLRYLQRHPWGEVSRLQVRPALRRMVDNVIHRYLASILERHVRSTDFLRRLEHMRPAV